MVTLSWSMCLSLDCKHDLLFYSLWWYLNSRRDFIFKEETIWGKANSIELLLFSRFCAVQCSCVILLNYPSEGPLVSIEFSWTNRKSNSLWFKATGCWSFLLLFDILCLYVCICIYRRMFLCVYVYVSIHPHSFVIGNYLNNFLKYSWFTKNKYKAIGFWRSLLG